MRTSIIGAMRSRAKHGRPSLPLLLLAIATPVSACVLHADGPGWSDAASDDADGGGADAQASPSVEIAAITVGADALGESCTADLADFPLLVSVEGLASLRTTGAGGVVQGTSGDDLVFRAADDTQLDYEIEAYDGASGSLVAWVRVPSLSSSADTTIFLYGGDSTITGPGENPHGVWNSGFAGVWHLHDDFEDSTARQNHGTNHGTSTAVGQIGDGQEFVNTEDDYIDCGAGESLNLTDAITLSAWVRPGSLPTADDFFDFVSKGNMYVLQFVKGTLQPRLSYMIPAGTWNTVNDPDVIDTIEFHHVAASFDVAAGANNAKLFVDGALVSEETYTEPIASTTASLTLGRFTDVRDFDGVLDEIRISNLARDACWLQTEFANQLEPSAFYTLTLPTRD